MRITIPGLTHLKYEKNFKERISFSIIGRSVGNEANHVNLYKIIYKVDPEKGILYSFRKPS